MGDEYYTGSFAVCEMLTGGRGKDRTGKKTYGPPPPPLHQQYQMYKLDLEQSKYNKIHLLLSYLIFLNSNI